MLKLINHIINEDKTRPGGSLEVTQFTRNCAHQIVSIKNACILNNSELSRISAWEGLSLSQSKTVHCLPDPQISRTISHVRASLLLSETLLQRDAARTRFSLGKSCCLHFYVECLAAMRKNWWYRWLYYSCHLIFYSKFKVVAGTISQSGTGKFNHQYNLLVKKRRGNWGYKINAEKNRSKEIKEKWKLYRSILGKYKYTSLELGCDRVAYPLAQPSSSGRGYGVPLGNIRVIALRIIYNRLALGKVALFYRNREFRSRLGAT